MVKIKDNKSQEVDDNNLSIKDLNINEIVPNVVENVIIHVFDNRCQLNLPSNMTGFDFKKWKNGRGGIFSKDLNDFLFGKNDNQYVLLKSEKERKIIRLINDNENKIFEQLNLIDGKIKDKNYMVIRTLYNEEPLTKNNRYIEQNTEETNIPIINISLNSNEDSENRDKDSISLFGDTL